MSIEDLEQHLRILAETRCREQHPQRYLVGDTFSCGTLERDIDPPPCEACYLVVAQGFKTKQVRAHAWELDPVVAALRERRGGQ